MGKTYKDYKVFDTNKFNEISRRSFDRVNKQRFAEDLQSEANKIGKKPPNEKNNFDIYNEDSGY